MRLDKPRVAPLPESQWTEGARAVIEPTRGMAGGKVFNIFSTLANHPELLKRWMVFANHVLVKSTLPPREREILILRIGWLCRAEYEWSQHVLIGKAVGLSEEEIDRISAGPDAPGWTEDDAALMITVHDDGRGIATEHHGAIFLPFRTLENGAEASGTGMGLAMVKKVLTTLGGEISVESNPAVERGTTFNVTWPKCPVT